MSNKPLLIGLLLLPTLSPPLHAESWQELLGTAQKILTQPQLEEAATAALSQSEMATAMKEALASGVESAITTLGQPDGFLGNALVKIPMPPSLASVEQLARKSGQGHYADQFITSINRAAEKAVPEASAILGDAIRQMSVTDVEQIISGPDDAATRYFERVSRQSLQQKLLPIIKQETGTAGVTAAYKNLVDSAGGVLNSLGPLSSFASGVTKAVDLDHYVTDQSLDALFDYIAIEERQIRTNPAARSTELLKKVFGTVAAP